MEKSSAAPSPSEVIEGDVPSDESVFLAEYGDQLIREALPFLNQVLRQFVTLNSAFLVAMVAFYDKRLLDFKFACAALVALFFSLGLSMFGILPITGSFARRDPVEIKLAVESGTRHKAIILRVAAFLFAIALFVLLVGFVLTAAQ